LKVPLRGKSNPFIEIKIIMGKTVTFSASITITCVDGIRKCWNGFGLWLWLGLGILPTTNYRSVLRSLLSAIALAKVDGEGGSPITDSSHPVNPV